MSYNLRRWFGSKPSKCPQPQRNQNLSPFVAAAALVSTGIIIGFAGAPASATPLLINGARTDVRAVMHNNVVFVPVRSIFGKLDTVVTYVPPNHVFARKGKRTVAQLSLGSRNVTVNGGRREIAAAPFVSRSRIFVPLRLISEAAGANVFYTVAPRAINIMARHNLAAPITAMSTQSVAVLAPVEQQQQQQAIPWWAWLLAALIILAIVFAVLLRRRKPNPIITTRSKPRDPTIRSR